jgi:hypothetical protein
MALEFELGDRLGVPLGREFIEAGDAGLAAVSASSLFSTVFCSSLMYSTSLRPSLSCEAASPRAAFSV